MLDMQLFPSASKYSFSDISLGAQVSQQVLITTEMINRFAEISGDFSPIHMNHETAVERGFKSRVSHGFLTGALVSQVIGMLLPGEYGLLHNVTLQFLKPVYADDLVTISVVVKEKQEAFLLVFLDVSVTNQHNERVCKGKIQMGLSR
jgi:3-hydroxybutyryl-CoA dehydratase